MVESPAPEQDRFHNLMKIVDPKGKMKNRMTATIVGLVLGLVCEMQAAGSASVSTDQPDYAPGSTVIITGSGFSSGETVTLQVLHDGVLGDNTTSTSHDPWTVVADTDGAFVSAWQVPLDEDEL